MPPILHVAAHPDDDTFGISRSSALQAADTDLRFVAVYATDRVLPPSAVTAPNGHV